MPYYYCQTCKYHLCGNCAYPHLIANINDRKHSTNSIIAEESMTSNKQLEEITKTKDEIIIYLTSRQKDIELEKNKLIEIKKIFNEKLNYLEKQFCYILEEIKKLQINKFQNEQETIIENIKSIISEESSSKYNNSESTKSMDFSEPLNETKIAFEQKFSKIREYFQELENNLYGEINKNFIDLIVIFNNFTKKRFFESKITYDNEIANLNLENNQNDDMNENINKYLNKKRKLIIKGKKDDINSENGNTIDQNITIKNYNKIGNKIGNKTNNKSKEINDKNAIKNSDNDNKNNIIDIKDDADDRGVINLIENKNENETENKPTKKKENAIKKKLCKYCKKTVRNNSMSKHIVKSHFDIAPDNLKYQIYAKKIINKIESLKVLVDEINNLQKKLENIKLEKKHQNIWWYYKYKILINEYNLIIKQNLNEKDKEIAQVAAEKNKK